MILACDEAKHHPDGSMVEPDCSTYGSQEAEQFTAWQTENSKREYRKGTGQDRVPRTCPATVTYFLQLGPTYLSPLPNNAIIL
jgi:hypothetical protein